MHIALVIERFDPFAGGAERSTAQIAGELIRRGHRVTILTGRGTRRRPSQRPPADQASAGDAHVPPEPAVVEAPCRVGTSLGLVLFSRWVRRQLAQGGYDVSMSVTMAAPASVLQPRGGTVRETLARNVAVRPTAAQRWLKQALIYLTPKYLVQLAMERRTLHDPMVRLMVPISGYVARQLQMHYGIDEAKMKLIPNAAETPRVDAAQRQAWRTAVRTSLAIPDDATVFLFAALNPSLKGFEPLLHALSLLGQRGVNAVVLLAGGLWYQHQQRACELEVREQVRFVRQTRQIAALYAASDATVLPTFYDPCSKVVIESLMMGVPAISSGYNGASDFIAPTAMDGPPRGYVVEDPWDVEGLADAMAAMADPEQRETFAAATVGLDEQLSMSRHVDRLEQVLRAARTAPQANIAT